MDGQDIINTLKSYDPNCDEALVKKAIDVTVKYHGTQIRESGEPYFYHPLEVASIVTEMRLDTASVITALLHDTVEDTDLTLEDIEKDFGKVGNDVGGTSSCRDHVMNPRKIGCMFSQKLRSVTGEFNRIEGRTALFR